MRRVPISNPHPMDQVNMIAKLGDLKDQLYQNTLALTAVIELLREKGMITDLEIRAKAAELDAQLDNRLSESFTPPEANPTW